MLLQQLWDNFLKILRSEIGNHVVTTWFKSASLISFDENNSRLVFEVPNHFVISWIKKNYLHHFKGYFPQALERQDLEFEFIATNTKSAYKKELIIEDSSAVGSESVGDSSVNQKNINTKVQGAKSIASSNKVAVASTVFQGQEKSKKSVLSSKYSFKNFIVGPHNHLAYSAAQVVSRGFSRRYNPLFIYGKTGLGKTHLLHCIGNEFRNNVPDGKVLYKTADVFVDEFIQAIRNDKVQTFTDKYRKVDLLLIDDVQLFAQKEQTQEAFFNIFNRMYDEKKQIVLTSDTHPQQMNGFQERLISRFSWGLSADISVPTYETRMAILLKKAEDLKVDLAVDVIQFIAQNFGNNIREMEGALIRLAAMTMLTLQPISLELAKKELNFKPVTCAAAVDIRPDDVVSVVLRDFGLTEHDLQSKKRENAFVKARQLVAYLLKKHTNCSLKSIGYYVGGRTHSTILHGISKVEQEILTDSKFASKIKSLEGVFR